MKNVFVEVICYKMLTLTPDPNSVCIVMILQWPSGTPGNNQTRPQACEASYFISASPKANYLSVVPIDCPRFFMCYGSQTPLAALEYWSEVMVFLSYCYCSYGEIKH